MKIKKFQQGGSADASQGQGQDPNAQQGGQSAQGAQQGQDPQAQIQQMSQQIIQQLGPQASMILAQTIMQMLQGAQGQGGGQPQGSPTYQRKGGKLVLINRK